MSVIVKGMEMPNNCKECALYIDGACYGKGYRDYRSIMDTAKPDDCPLVELPPHGRLIDADNIYVDGEGYFWFSENDAPTIIEAEGET